MSALACANVTPGFIRATPFRRKSGTRRAASMRSGSRTSNSPPKSKWAGITPMIWTIGTISGGFRKIRYARVPPGTAPGHSCDTLGDCHDAERAPSACPRIVDVSSRVCPDFVSCHWEIWRFSGRIWRRRRSEKPSPCVVFLPFSDERDERTRRVCPRVCPERCAQTIRRHNVVTHSCCLHLERRRRRFEREPPSLLRRRALPRKCLCHVYLETCGEVAERLKAAVC